MRYKEELFITKLNKVNLIQSYLKNKRYVRKARP